MTPLTLLIVGYFLIVVVVDWSFRRAALKNMKFKDGDDVTGGRFK